MLLCGRRVVSVRALGHFKVSGGSEGARVACPPSREPPLSVLGPSKWGMAVYGSRVVKSRVKLPVRWQGSLPSRLVSPRPKWRRARDKEPAPGGEGTRGQRRIREQTCGSRLERALLVRCTKGRGGNRLPTRGELANVQPTDECISDYTENLGRRMLLNEENSNVSYTSLY